MVLLNFKGYFFSGLLEIMAELLDPVSGSGCPCSCRLPVSWCLLGSRFIKLDVHLMNILIGYHFLLNGSKRNFGVLNGCVNL